MAERLPYSPSLEIAIGPSTFPSRQDYIDYQLRLDGLAHIQEDPKAAYCALSLTSTPDRMKPIVKQRQDTITDILRASGITPYDPNSSPFSPDIDLTKHPDEVSRVDSGQIASARFFVAHDMGPSTGVGIEMEKASKFNRISVIFHDKRIRTSRMRALRSIHLEYSHLENQSEKLVKIFEFLSQFEPGMGFFKGRPILLGFQNNSAVNLEQVVYDQFPEFNHVYNGEKPILEMKLQNPQVLYENIH